MAERRMFAKMIIDSDAFLEMPQSTQLLYFHLGMRADDDGFVNKPKSIMRMAGSRDDDMLILISKKFIIPFETGVVVIKHWKIHNLIKGDRYHETKYQEEKAKLVVDPVKKSYRLKEALELGTNLEPTWNPDGTKVEPQVRLGKVSLDQDSKDLIVGEKNPPTPPEPKKYKFNQSHMELAQHLLDCIRKNKPDFKEPSLNDWADVIRLMRERDNRKHETIRDVIEWCQSDSFWKSNILSADKLRKQFDKLEMQMNEKGNRRQPPKESSLSRLKRIARGEQVE